MRQRQMGLGSPPSVKPPAGHQARRHDALCSATSLSRTPPTCGWLFSSEYRSSPYLRRQRHRQRQRQSETGFSGGAALSPVQWQPQQHRVRTASSQAGRQEVPCAAGVVGVLAAPVAQDDAGADGGGHPAGALIVCDQPDVVPPTPPLPATAAGQ
jgi:hypothetical protein